MSKIFYRSFIIMLVFVPLVVAGCTGGSANSTSIEAIIVTPTPDVSNEPEQIGSGDKLEMLYSEPPTMLNPHLALSQTDLEVARIVYEPLASYDNDGNLVPFLAAEIPSVDNGNVAFDGLSVTWKLRDDVFWSDGEPFSAEDVKFTFDFINNPDVDSASLTTYDTVDNVEVIDDHTVKVNFKRPNPAWEIPFVGLRGLIIPKHKFEAYNGANAGTASVNTFPVGTGPYQTLSPGIKPQEILFLGSEIVQTNKIEFEPNPFYRNKDNIYFSEIELRGGGTDSEAARLSIGTGDVDIAWDLNIPVDELADLEAKGNGEILTSFGATVEQIELNRTDPNEFTASGENSSLDHPHPFLSDSGMRHAIAHAINRDAIVELYGAAGRPALHILVSPPQFASGTEFYNYNPEKAAALLDEAGWIDSDNNGTRDKEGEELSVVFQTEVNSVRQDVQRIVKSNLEDIGIEVEIKIIDSSVFYGTDVENLNNVQRFSADLQSFPWNSLSPDPGIFLQFWTCDQVAQQSNNWSGFNSSRFCSQEYDALYEQSQVELDPEKRRDIFVQMNDILTEDVALIPLVDQARISGVNPNISGFAPTPWDALTWNIEQWRRN